MACLFSVFRIEFLIAVTILFVAGAGIEPDVSLAQRWVMSPVSLTSTLTRNVVQKKGIAPLF